MPRTLTDDDLIAVLEDVIQNGESQTARISAIRMLREWEDAGKRPAMGDMAELDELAPRRRSHVQTKG